MGILDEAIKEHLELKRQHGAGVSELKKLEDEAFGQADRPGAEEAVSEQFSEAPTEFMSQPAAPEARTEAAPDLEAPEQETRVTAEAESAAVEKPHVRRTPAHELADLQEAPPPGEPAEEESPAMEHEAISPPPTDREAGAAESEPPASAPEPSAPEPESSVPEPSAPEPESSAPEPEAAVPEPAPSAGPSTEERHAIAEQPTEHYDIEQELASSEPGPSEEQLVEEEISEPRLAPVDPLAALEGVDTQERGDAPEQVDTPEQPATAEQAALDDEDAASAPAAEKEEHDDDFFDEKRLSDELDQALEAPAGDERDDSEIGGWHTEEHEAVSGSGRPSRKGEDVLDETPDFLEEAPEDDQLWFEQKPPKDFDFDD